MSFYFFFFSLMSISKSFYSVVAGLLVAQNTFAAGAESVFDKNGYANKLNLGNQAGTPGDVIAGIIVTFLSLVTIIAVGYVLWAGFQILTAGGEEEKVKSGRKTIINVVIGIVVMWLAYWIVKLILNALV
jgi:Type IV secretion system pilin